jgi:alkanesulfonate monooxygenase SsuD/methylene tetrahydromethanopterin reductase-like flavin-dependent oxidoreductase (luciferase family)
MLMKFGLWFCNTGRYVDPKNAVALAQAAEAAGFESVWTVEHTIVPAGYCRPQPVNNSVPNIVGGHFEAEPSGAPELSRCSERLAVACAAIADAVGW